MPALRTPCYNRPCAERISKCGKNQVPQVPKRRDDLPADVGPSGVGRLRRGRPWTQMRPDGCAPGRPPARPGVQKENALVPADPPGHHQIDGSRHRLDGVRGVQQYALRARRQRLRGHGRHGRGGERAVVPAEGSLGGSSRPEAHIAIG